MFISYRKLIVYLQALLTGVLVSAAEPIRVLFLGDSLTAGYGLSVEEAYPAKVKELAARDGVAIEVIQGGVSGDTTAGGISRIGWYLQGRVDVLVLALGANDALRGIDPAATETNLQGMIDEARRFNPSIRILLVGMKAPPNMGFDFAESFASVYERLAKKNELELMPFLLQGVARRPSLNLEDGIHPNAEGHAIMADHVWRHLRDVIDWGAASP